MRRVLSVAAALLVAAAAPPPAPPCAALCQCRADHLACDAVPFHRFPATGAAVRHVAVSAARLGALGEAALDARPLRTLVLVASHLHHIEPAALTSMASTLASLDLGYNDFTEIPLEALRELKVLNWLNLQNNYIAEVEAGLEWGELADSLSSLSLSNNHLVALGDSALTALHRLVHLDLEGNRLHAVAGGALPPALALLRLSDNLLPELPCAALARLPRLRHLHLRNNPLRPAAEQACRAAAVRLDSLDLAHSELDDLFAPDARRLRPRRLVLDLNEFTAVPAFAAEGGRLERLSMCHNRLARVSDATLHALDHLERLELDHNELTALGPAATGLLRLRRLSLAYNRIEEAEHLPPRLESLALAGNLLAHFPAGLRRLTPASLLHLDLGYNRIASVSASDFGPWAGALATLGLRGNRVAELAADAFPAALPLRELALGFNELYRVERTAFANLTHLRVLELSAAGGALPPAPLTPPVLSWLALDNGDLHRVTARDLAGLATLEYLNLDFNRIAEFPSDATAEGAVRFRLKELRLSYNYVSRVDGEFLQNFVELENLDLSYNRLRNVSEGGFANLPNLAYLNLAGNQMDRLADGAFQRLPRLAALDLHENRLLEFSARPFEDVSSDDFEFAVNVSHNHIAALATGAAHVPLRALDLSHNRLESVSAAFFASLARLRRLSLAHNRLSALDGASFGALPELLVLSLSDNRLSVARRRAFADMPELRILELSRNRLAQLAAEQFHGLRELRHLRLDGNELRALPRDCFRGTLLEHLDLADNRLAVYPSSALAQVGFTLRRLELARNRLEHLDAAMFRATAFLHELGLAGNALTALADNTLAPLARLHRLDLSGNALKANFKELFGGLPRLRRLALADAGLRAVPPLPLANLTDLELAGNGIAAFREGDVRRLPALRRLGLARNRLTALQPAMWAALPHLVDLDVSANPIVRIVRASFEGLGRLLALRLERLRRLEAVEPRAFLPLRTLRSLVLEWPAGGARGVALADVVGAARALETLTVTLCAEELDEQLAGVAAPRLRVLEVRGEALRRVSSRAFASLGRQRALTVRLRGTGVAALPAGLVRPLARVPLLALDFSDNRLASFSPAALYPNLTDWGRLATKLLPGGLALGGNELRCGCGVSWLGAWLRRWTAEVGGWSAGARTAARAAQCRGAGGVAALVALRADEAQCHASALSARAPRPRPTLPARLFLWLVLLYAVS